MSKVETRSAIKNFVEFWKDKGYEKGESQKFWIQLLREVLNIEHPEQFISFEDKVKLDHTSFIDGYIPSTKVLIEQKAKIEKMAQGILDSRALYPQCSFADLYDELTMPSELRKAHQENDKAVMEAYGFKKQDETGKTRWLTESETVAELMKMYKELTEI